MVWDVRIKTKTSRQIQKLPQDVQKKMFFLAQDLRVKGLYPGPKWQNFSPLGPGEYHCHLSYKWVACWREIDENLMIMEVYYVGSREKAPY